MSQGEMTADARKSTRRKQSDRADLSRYASAPGYDPALSVEESGVYMGGYDPREVRRMIAEKELACVRRATPGGRSHIRIRLSELNRWLKANTHRASRGGAQG